MNYCSEPQILKAADVIQPRLLFGGTHFNYIFMTPGCWTNVRYTPDQRQVYIYVYIYVLQILIVIEDCTLTSQHH